MRPLLVIFLGLILSLVGSGIPLLIVIHVLPSTYFLNFFAAICMFIGLFLGIIGASQYIGIHHK